MIRIYVFLLFCLTLSCMTTKRKTSQREVIKSHYAIFETGYFDDDMIMDTIQCSIDSLKIPIIYNCKLKRVGKVDYSFDMSKLKFETPWIHNDVKGSIWITNEVSGNTGFILSANYIYDSDLENWFNEITKYTPYEQGVIQEEEMTINKEQVSLDDKYYKTNGNVYPNEDK